MVRLTSAVMGGIAVGLLLGAGAALTTDDKDRRRMMRNSKRAMRKAGDFFEDIF